MHVSEPRSTPRRLAILTEGQFRVHNAKTAMGVIRYGTNRVVALSNSSIAGRNVSEFLPGHDIPAVATLAEALAMPEPPDALLIGIAPMSCRNSGHRCDISESPYLLSRQRPRG